MENASKALLIAAAVLIVILIIAFGMKIFNSTGDTSADAVEVGKAVKGGTALASNEILKQSILSKVGSNKTEQEQKDVINLIIKFNEAAEKAGDEQRIYCEKRYLATGELRMPPTCVKSNLDNAAKYLTATGERGIKKGTYTNNGKEYLLISIEL